MSSSAKSHIARGVGRMSDLVMKQGQGSRVTTTCGRDLLDFTSGIGVVNCGHSHPRIIQAAKDQCDRIVHSQVNIAYHEPQLELTEALLPRVAPLDSLFFATTGAEAVENAVKMARAYTGKHAIVVMKGGYHGRTFGTMAMTTSSRIYRQKFGPLLGGIHVSPFPDPLRGYSSEKAMAELEQLFKDTLHEDDVAAIICEPVLGEGGYVPAPAEFLQSLQDFCKARNILWIADEVQTGFGRTGSWFTSYTKDDLQPDLISMAKGLGNGFPISAVATRQEIADACDPGMLGGTYAGNAVACAAAVATQKVLEEEGLCENSLRLGDNLRAELANLQADVGSSVLTDIRGLGLMVGVEFASDLPATFKSDLSQACLDRNLLLLSCSTYNVMRFIAPLNTPDEELDEGIGIFADSLKHVLEK